MKRAMPELAGRARLHVMLHEIWIDGEFSASIYPSATGVRIVSKHEITSASVVDTEGLTVCDVKVKARPK